MYVRTTQGKQEFSTCQSIKLIYNHDDLVIGQWVSNPSAELIAAEDWMEYIPPVIPPQPQYEPSEYDKTQALLSLSSVQQEIVAYDDQSAVLVKALFTTWKSLLDKQEHKADTDPDVVITLGERVYYDGELWKCQYPHTPQASWNPRDAHSLFVMISIEDGSKEHPIKFSQGMILENGKYYTQYDVEYLCIRDSGIGIYADLSALVGNYVELVNE